MIGPGYRLVTGVEPDYEETRLASKEQRPIVRAYIDARSLGHYVLVTGDQAREIARAWKGSFMGHLTLYVPRGAPVYQAVPA